MNKILKRDPTCLQLNYLSVNIQALESLARTHLASLLHSYPVNFTLERNTMKLCSKKSNKYLCVRTYCRTQVSCRLGENFGQVFSS